MCGDLPYCLCAVPGFTFDTPAYVQCPGCLRAVLCFAWPYLTSTPPLMRGTRGALLCLRAVLCFASTGPGVLRQPRLTSYVLCGALLYLRQPLALPSTPPGVFCPALPLACFAPGVLCLRALLCLLCFACFAYVFSTHTEGGDPGSLHEKKIKTKEF